MSIMSLKHELTAEEALKETIINDPDEDNFIRIMDRIRMAVKRGEFGVLVSGVTLHNKRKLMYLGYKIKTTNDQTWINW